MSKTSFVAFNEWKRNCEILSDKEFGQLMRAVFEYNINGTVPEFTSRTVQACWNPIKDSLDRSAEAYEQRCEKNRENGKKGGRPKKKEEEEKPNGFSENPKKANGFSENPTKPKKTLPDPDSDPDPERDPQPDAADAADTRAQAREAASAAPAEFSSWEKEQIVTEWNTNKTTKNIFRIDPMSARAENALACVELVGFQKFLEVIGSADNQGFFQKRFQNGKPITFDWFVKPENFTKVIEGNYAEEWSDDGLVVHEGWEVV